VHAQLRRTVGIVVDDSALKRERLNHRQVCCASRVRRPRRTPHTLAARVATARTPCRPPRVVLVRARHVPHATSERTSTVALQVRADEKRAGARKAEQRERNALKRQRPQLSARELKDGLKACFARQPYWSRRDLVAELGNAESLSACLDELCVKVTKKGAHYGDFQLKEHLRTGLSAAAGAASSSAPMP
jgi:hypothetical protein